MTNKAAVHVLRAFLQFEPEARPLLEVEEEFQIPRGASLLVAPSGSGKTTLLRLMSGWYERDSGSPASFDLGANYDPLRDVEFIGNHQTLLPWYTARGNVALRGGGRATAEKLWAEVGLPLEALDSYPYELSLGMYKRAELVAALSRPVRLLLLDEYFSSLDPQARERSLAVILAADRDPPAVLISTHTPEAFPQVQRRFEFKTDADGRIRRVVRTA